MDAREILERRIDELCLENGRLRGQVARLTSRSIRTADKMDCLETENAKLRGARDVWQENDAKLRELGRHLYECAFRHSCAACEYADDACDFEYDMRELGIEVDE